ncbi:phenylacetate--CoA ligase [Parabacteroides sp. AGMB00274]|jgi:phenylacetate-CoA ligase|uniref:Phenylacetate-coenzyme A ligase n=1 Tax=Parabacteroides faecalis TaxID=2924040 RepID=A0ABT0C3F2_9BACT|nr:phenylacetate--CoA ligase [Parabacteroides faecalis]MCI7285777.1 phenylacetate--CoA ligase [Parabacteroides sp.]MCJ2381552.1 phenylacetate--CoA ligase [Parabacteroides faecalis]MDY6253699.1 phenylacetate--CoA ligase [Bacteroidales bacterium]
MEYWQKDIETMGRDQLQELQLTRLKETVKHAANSPFYKEVFEKNGITPDSIQTLDDLRKIPFTTKNDLRSHYPFGMAAIPIQKCVRIHSSSGTTGNPTVVLHSAKDLDQWANQVARCMYMVGLRDTDVFQNTSGYGMFTGGLGFQYGAERLGALTVPAAAGNTKRQIKFITDFGTTCLHIIPSYATRLAEVMYEMGIDPRRDTKLHTVCIGAEPHSEEQRKRIEQLLGVKAYNCFGMSEMNGPGVAFECPEQNGLHIWEDYVIPEIINPQTLEPVPEGEIGELVLTTINREAMPLLRYRTRDLTRFIPGECPCGRTHRRLARFVGRSDDMIILKGVNIFPIQIEKILMNFKELGSNYLITIETVGYNDEMLIEVELSDLFTDDYSALQRLAKEVTRQLKDELLLTPRVKLVGKGSLPSAEGGKAVRVKDLRKLC